MFDRPWLILLGAIVAIGFLISQPALFALPIFMYVLIGAGRWWQRRVLNRVRYARRFSYTHVFPDEPVDMTIEAHNDKRLPVPWLIAQDSLPEHIHVQDATSPDEPPQATLSSGIVHSFVLRGGGQSRVRLRLSSGQRGFYAIGPAVLHSGDPFSLFETMRTEDRRAWLVVYPKIVPLAELGIPAKDLFGEKRAHQRIFEDPSRTMGVRDYQPGDSMRHIHWKATARQGALQTRVYEHTVSTSVMICLNVATFPHAWQGVDPERLEHAIELCASIAYEGAERGYAIGVAANCGAPLTGQSIHVPPNRAPDQLRHVLEALAAVTHYIVTPFDSFLLRESPRVRWGATLVVVTPLTTAAILGAVSQLRDAGRRVVLISTDDEPPWVKNVQAYHVPMQGETDGTRG
ncbi:MAG TPA: DUF58 domain-containing protein [Anaerolineae bacterium]|nr:DUF58 domain-containing protein [Anaerolineae bacterium]